MSKHKIATMTDVARKAGVAIGTVSNVLNHSAAISEETEKKVKKAIKDLNYIPNRNARALRASKSRMIGFMVPDATNDYYSMISKVFNNNAQKSGYTVSLLNYEYDVKLEEKQIRDLINQNVDAIVLFNGYKDDEMIEKIGKTFKNVPILLIDRRKDNFISIEYDNKNTMIKVIDMLSDKGYRLIGYFSETIELMNLNNRYAGFVEGMKKNGLDIDDRFVLTSKISVKSNLELGYDYMKTVLESYSFNEIPKVFVTSSDLIAIGAMRALKEKNYIVPGDIALVGFDNIELSEYSSPALTTVEQDKKLMGEKAWETVSKMIEGNSAFDGIENLILPQTIVYRQSC